MKLELAVTDKVLIGVPRVETELVVTYTSHTVRTQRSHETTAVFSSTFAQNILHNDAVAALVPELDAPILTDPIGKSHIYERQSRTRSDASVKRRDESGEVLRFDPLANSVGCCICPLARDTQDADELRPFQDLTESN